MGKVEVALAAGCTAAACVVAAVMVGRRVRRRRGWKRALRVLEELEEGCATPVGRLRQVVDAMAVEMHAGLASEGGSKLKMLLTYICDLPTGTEKGIYYALDLGGTHFRVLRVKLGGQSSATIIHDVERQPIPQHLMTGTSEELFDYIATSLKDFVEREENASEPSQGETNRLGFTFSFPVKQTSSSSGTLVKLTNGFSIDDMVGRDVAQCLQEAIYRKGLNMQVVSLFMKYVLLDEEQIVCSILNRLINDTVGTLALGHYHDEDTVVAVIFGTGTNACYLERTDAIIKCQGLLATTGRMVVNMEWGNFWSSHLPRTSYDVDLDADSPNPNIFEKVISGMYLGDIVRRVILRMSQESDVFGSVSSKIHIPFILRTPMIASMHEDDSPDLIEVARLLQDTLEICDVVTRRAARLAAAGIVGILKKIGRDGYLGGKSKIQGKMTRTVVAVEGDLYSNYTMFREYLNEALGDILGDDVAARVVMKVTEDGSGIGVALLAASTSSEVVGFVLVVIGLEREGKVFSMMF
ncbi:hexokinase [Striga asiatica]|uniref:Phosphotransferase n=1 Tax=Striga asiatica TaxID=4170 RepID=A0A5A7Q8P0_STRAF|nr:hexokinase [Striga asiatica]